MTTTTEPTTATADETWEVRQARQREASLKAMCEWITEREAWPNVMTISSRDPSISLASLAALKAACGGMECNWFLRGGFTHYECCMKGFKVTACEITQHDADMGKINL